VTIFNIVATSKNKKEFNLLILFLCYYLFFNSNIIKKISSKKIKKNKISLLKSPHVNKKSQEQFEIRWLKKNFILKIQKSFKYLVFLKKISCNMFSNLNLKIKQILNNKQDKFNIVLNSNFFRIKLKVFKINNLKNFKLIKKINLSKKKTKFKNLLAKKINSLVNIFELSGSIIYIK
jgi:hypothetical protein